MRTSVSIPPATPHGSGEGWWRRNEMRFAPAVFLLPAAIMFGLFVVYPAVQSVILSFYDWDGINEPFFIGIENYRELWDDPVFWTALKNNVIWLALFMLAPVFGLALAVLLNQTFTGVRLVKSLFFFPFVISQVVVGLVFVWFYNPQFGLFQHLTGLLGLDPIVLLESENWATVGIVLAGLWPQTAYCMILYFAGLTAINPELIEAGRLDGARGFRLFRHVVLPQLRPATFIAVVVSVIGALRSFDLIAIMTAGGPYNSSTVLAYYMYEQTFLSFRYGYGAAIATVLFLIMDLYIAFFLWRMLRQERR